jgi:hypothetical protein
MNILCAIFVIIRSKEKILMNTYVFVIFARKTWNFLKWNHIIMKICNYISNLHKRVIRVWNKRFKNKNNNYKDMKNNWN